MHDKTAKPVVKPIKREFAKAAPPAAVSTRTMLKLTSEEMGDGTMILSSAEDDNNPGGTTFLLSDESGQLLNTEYIVEGQRYTTCNYSKNKNSLSRIMILI